METKEFDQLSAKNAFQPWLEDVVVSREWIDSHDNAKVPVTLYRLQGKTNKYIVYNSY